MERIIKSLTPATLQVAAAVVFALGTAFVLAADATLADSSRGASGDLSQAGLWLQFLAVVGLLGAVCTAGWEATMRSEWVAGAEIAVAAVGTLLLTIGFAALAANAASAAAPVAGAVGIGVWALLVLSRAARASLAEQAPAGGAVPGASGGAVPGTGGGGRQADLWLAAAIGLFVLAIGYGFTAAAGNTGPDIAAGLLEAAGLAVLAGAVTVARSRRMLNSRPVPFVLIGLALLAVSFLARAVVAGLDFGTVSALGAGLVVVNAVALAAVAVLGIAAWTQVRALYPVTRTGAASTGAGQAPGL